MPYKFQTSVISYSSWNRIFKKLMNSKKNDFNLKRQNVSHNSEQHIAPKITKLESYHADTNSNLLAQQQIAQEPQSTNCSQKKTRGRVKIDIEVKNTLFVDFKKKSLRWFQKKKFSSLISFQIFETGILVYERQTEKMHDIF